VPAGQLLGPDQDTYVDWSDLLGRDQARAARVSAASCDIGAIQAGVGR
jgi:hypothetical protein